MATCYTYDYGYYDYCNADATYTVTTVEAGTYSTVGYISLSKVSNSDSVVVKVSPLLKRNWDVCRNEDVALRNKLRLNVPEQKPSTYG